MSGRLISIRHTVRQSMMSRRAISGNIVIPKSLRLVLQPVKRRGASALSSLGIVLMETATRVVNTLAYRLKIRCMLDHVLS